MVGFGRARLGMVRHGAVWHGMVRCGFSNKTFG